jgi:predicted nicotinamide N-methyase
MPKPDRPLPPLDSPSRELDGSAPFLHNTPAEACRDRREQTISIAGRSFTLCLPAAADELLDHPATHAAFKADEYLPYWAELWPAAEMLAGALLTHAWPPGACSEHRVWEIGCGVGLPGLAALSLGMQVTFSDYDGTALRFAAHNARANGFCDFATCQMDWRHPPLEGRATLLLAADVVYEARHVSPIVKLIQQMLAPQGECWLVDPDRIHAGRLRRELDRERFVYRETPLQVDRAPAPFVCGTLYRIRRHRAAAGMSRHEPS